QNKLKGRVEKLSAKSHLDSNRLSGSPRKIRNAAEEHGIARDTDQPDTRRKALASFAKRGLRPRTRASATRCRRDVTAAQREFRRSFQCPEPRQEFRKLRIPRARHRGQPRMPGIRLWVSRRLP